jgi:hypothetical protein
MTKSTEWATANSQKTAYPTAAEETKNMDDPIIADRKPIEVELERIRIEWMV